MKWREEQVGRAGHGRKGSEAKGRKEIGREGKGQGREGEEREEKGREGIGMNGRERRDGVGECEIDGKGRDGTLLPKFRFSVFYN